MTKNKKENKVDLGENLIENILNDWIKINQFLSDKIIIKTIKPENKIEILPKGKKENTNDK
jgi:hypothetical protein